MASNFKHTNSDKYNKALTLIDRGNLEKLIEQNRDASGNLTMTLNEMAKILEKDPTTLSKEIKKHRTPFAGIGYNFRYIHQYCKHCSKLKDCKNKPTHKIQGSCKEFEQMFCKHTLRFPLVCNGCRKRGLCELPKTYYNHVDANHKYTYTLSDSRIGSSYSYAEFKAIDEIVSKGIRNGQSLEHIIHSNDLPISLRTAYNYLHKEYFDVNESDLRRIVRFKSRKRNLPTNSKMLKEKKKGRSYEDFTELLTEKPGLNYVQMDTVEGIKGGKVILSLMLVNIKFQFYFLLDNKKASTVVDKLNEIESIIGTSNFQKIFGIILTDNGSEFSDIDGIISNLNTGEVRTQLYFCHPMRSDEKGLVNETMRY